MLNEVENRDKFFEVTSNTYSEILEHYNKEDAIDGPWRFTPIYDILGAMPDKTHLFKSISNSIEKISGYTLLAMGISDFSADRNRYPHKDNHPKDGRFKRYHLALQLTDTSFLYVMEDGTDEWVAYPWVLGKWMRFDGIHHYHYPYNETEGKSRIVVLLDILEGDAEDKDVYDYYEYIETLGWIVGVDYRKNYLEYVSGRAHEKSTT